MNAKPKFEGVRGCCVTDGMGIICYVICYGGLHLLLRNVMEGGGGFQKMAKIVLRN